ncbi:efflux RND transporter periplasmic adaptor subunit [Polynucleobacter sp. 30F-ANTBAC]|uniref:efflux RND transporter periplasmic adaptor subunit n=1 Tax=Polynucleobacter sp. 30F-ANTBAC TaxID=2689095 RepID=UPI001C0D13A1|nr:efflux RND transporter periplasmic adaptor subunit [Polynucleobacter sp. 30F-ANTBAC]MBU3600578.1 efflux RND transporter periplasmic adaptor subunit [Polynucleobacter sp. 30F-ANTBAC]
MPFIEKLKARLLACSCQVITQLTQLIKKIDIVKIYAFCMLHKKKIIAGIVILYGLNYAYNYFFPDTGKKMPPQLVTTILVEKKDIPVILEATGNIVAKNIVDIRPQTTNVVSKIHIKEGQAVKAGDLLFTLDDRASKANFDKAKALADDATRQYKRSLELIEKKFISQAAADTSKANMESAKANARAAEVALSFDHIRSPINGRAGVINVFVGSLVQAGTNVSTTSSATSTTTTGAMATITQLDPINVQFTISEKEIPLILGKREEGDDLSVSVEVNGADKPVEGKVYVVDNQVDPAIGAVRVKAELSNQAGLMIPGQFVRIKLKAKTLKDALVIPTHAVVTNTKGDFLYVVDKENKVDLTPIKIIHQYLGQSVISGVNLDDKIVVEGKQNLRPKGQIRETKSAEKAKSQ